MPSKKIPKKQPPPSGKDLIPQKFKDDLKTLGKDFGLIARDLKEESQKLLAKGKDYWKKTEKQRQEVLEKGKALKGKFETKFKETKNKLKNS